MESGALGSKLGGHISSLCDFKQVLTEPPPPLLIREKRPYCSEGLWKTVPSTRPTRAAARDGSSFLSFDS